MAQNAYGLKICGIACLGFALTFLHEIFFAPGSADDQLVAPWLVYVELIFLSVIALVFLLRNFSTDLPFSDTLLAVSLTGLLLLSLYQAILQVKIAGGHQITLVYLMTFFYGAVLFFILSFLLSIVFSGMTFNVALVAMVLIAVFAVLSLVFKKVTVSGEAISIWHYIRQMKNKSAILLIACMLISGYSLLYSAGILPPFYYGTPRGYQHLIELSNAGDGKVGKEKPREFKERYEAFIRKHSAR